eukprot:sb/3461423/
MAAAPHANATLPSRSTCMLLNAAGFNPGARSNTRWKRDVPCMDLHSLREKGTHVPFIGITETWLKDYHLDAQISIPGYRVIRADRASRQGGGVLLFVDEGVPVKCSASYDDGTCEVIICRLATSKMSERQEMAGGLRGKLSKVSALSFLTEQIEKDPDGDLVVMGDFNFPMINWKNMSVGGRSAENTRSAQDLLSFMETHFLEQFITLPTRGQNILDLFLANRDTLVVNSNVEETELSDHRLVSVGLTFHPLCPQKRRRTIPESFRSLDFNSGSFDLLRQKLSDIDWCGLRSRSDFESFPSVFTDTVYRVCCSVFPQVKIPSGKPRCFKKLRRQKVKLRARIAALTEKGQVAAAEEAKVELANLCLEMKDQILTRKDNRERKAVGKMKSDPRYFYSFAKSFAKGISGIPVIIDKEGSPVTDPKQIADIFQEEFCGVFSNPENPQTRDPTFDRPTIKWDDLGLNDLEGEALNAILSFFADDSRVSMEITNEGDTVKLQQDLDRVLQWSTRNNMVLNEDKYELMVHHHHRGALIKELPMTGVFYSTSGDTLLTPSDQLRDLGVTVSEDLSWRPHYVNLTTKGRRMAQWVLSVFSNRDPELMVSLYKTMVRSTMEYCSPLWSPQLVGDIQLLESVQRRFTSKIAGMKDLDYWQRLKYLGLMSLQRRRERYVILHGHKILHGAAPNEVDMKFHRTSRHGLKAVLPDLSRVKSKRNSTLYANSFGTFGPKLWNCIPADLREIEDLASFKANLDLFLREVPDLPPTPGYPANNRNLLTECNLSLYLSLSLPLSIYLPVSPFPSLSLSLVKQVTNKNSIGRAELSDHRLVSVGLTFHPLCPQKRRRTIPESFRSLDFNSGSFDLLRQKLSDIDWCGLRSRSDFESFPSVFTDTVSRVCCSVFPQVKIPSGKPRCFKKLRRQKVKLRARIAALTEKGQVAAAEEAKVELANLCLEMKDQILTRKDNRERKAVGKMKSDPRYFYSFAKSFAKGISGIPVIIDKEGSPVTDPKQIADIFQEEFCGVFSNPENPQTRDPTFDRPTIKWEDLGLTFSEEDIVKACKDLDISSPPVLMGYLQGSSRRLPMPSLSLSV